MSKHKQPARHAGLLAAVLIMLASACVGGNSDEVAGDEVPSGPDVASLEAEVRAASAAWDEAFNAGDVDSLIGLYADEAVSMPYYAPALEGVAAIEEDFRGFFADFAATHHTAIVSVAIAGDTAIERGLYTLEVTARDGSESWEEAGKHIVIRRLTEDGWKVVWEIWNLDE